MPMRLSVSSRSGASSRGAGIDDRRRIFEPGCWYAWAEASNNTTTGARMLWNTLLPTADVFEKHDVF